MDVDNVFGAIGVIILACGLYCFYAYYKMVKTGEPSDVILLSKGDATRACKDKPAFMAKAKPLVLMLSAVTTLYGIIDVVNSYVTPMAMVDTVAGIIFFIVLIIYMVQTQKIKRQYYNI